MNIIKYKVIYYGLKDEIQYNEETRKFLISPKDKINNMNTPNDFIIWAVKKDEELKLHKEETRVD